MASALLALIALPAFGCKMLHPSNRRDWEPDQALLPSAEFDGASVTVRNVRNCRYLSDEEYALDYYDKTYDLDHLTSVDFILAPFPGLPAVAHTMLSFGFNDQDYLAVSVEVRKEKGEKYRPMLAMLRQYELMYVVADERDVIGVRTNQRKQPVYVYPTRTTPQQRRALFVDVMRRVNELRQQPEFYHTLTNNCTTNMVNHFNHVAPGLVPYDSRVLLPGYFDRLAYERGLINTDGAFEEARFLAQVNGRARRWAAAPDFSQRIRR